MYKIAILEYEVAWQIPVKFFVPVPGKFYSASLYYWLDITY